MNTTFINPGDIKASGAHVLVLNITNELDLRRDEEIIALSNLIIYYTWKNIKRPYNNNKFKYKHQHGMINLNYLTDCILCLIFKIILSIF